jgi:hypothetical protein
MHTIKRPACNGQGNILNHFQRIYDALKTKQDYFQHPAMTCQETRHFYVMPYISGK